jgi:UDP-glucose 4-epimerase
LKLFVTGGAGFVGSNLIDAALERGHEVTCFDNFSTGKHLFLEHAVKHPRFTLVEGDITDLPALTRALVGGFDWVLHYAANADVRRGPDQPRKDLDTNTIGTWNVLEAARANGTKKILFSSTGSVYGEPTVFPTPEDAPFPEQTSLYGASKLAGEALISAYCHGFGFTGVVFRMVSVLGPRYTHGHVFDFIQKLRRDPTRLPVLGDGTQTKSYLHVVDLVGAFLKLIDAPPTAGFNVLNVGHDGALQVHQSVALITERLKLTPRIEYAGGKRGWVGDSPRIQLDTSRLKKLGWAPSRSLEDAVRETVDFLAANPSLLD